MSDRSIEGLQRYLRRLRDEAAAPKDAALLQRFVTAQDREAFELLVVRHGPMVLGTARRLVDNSHDAEDVFQAVFLSLARLATSIRHGIALPAWLHRTTRRIAARLRARRPTTTAPTSEPMVQDDPDARLLWREVRAILDEELQRLPERLRAPLLLCYLSGLTRDEAAKQLGWSLGTLKRRLEEGRNMLRIRLAARGIASAALALAVLTPEALQAAVSQALLDSCLRLVFAKDAVVPAAIAVLAFGSASTMKGIAMKSTIALLAACVLGVGIYTATGAADPAPDADAGIEVVAAGPQEKDVPRDDPLPAGSTLRFGTTRFRHGIPVATLAVSPDGKTAFVANDNHIHGMARAFDLATGRVQFSLADVWNIEVGVYSPDGRTLVTKEREDLFIRDAVTGKVLRKIKGPQSANGPSTAWTREFVQFTPDGKNLVLTSEGKFVHLLDIATGKTIRTIAMANPKSSLSRGFPSMLDVAFTRDGKQMATGGYDNDKGNYFARLWDVETGKELRRFMLGKQGYGVRCLAFSPDGKTLATLGTQSGVILRLFDVDTGKERKAFPKDGDQRTVRGSIAFSPDGKTLAAAGASIRLIDMTTGEERLRIDRRAGDLHFSSDGKTLTAGVSGAIHRWNATTGQLLTPEGADSVVEQILVTPDGSRVVTRGQDGDAHLWDGVTGRHLRRFRAGWQRGLAMSPDGRYLAWPVDDPTVQFTEPQSRNSIYTGSRVFLYDVAAGRSVDRFPGFKGDGHDLAFTPDGKKLVTVDQHPGTVRIWDFATGKEQRSFDVGPSTVKKKGVHVPEQACLSLDGKTAAVVYEEHSTIERFGLRGPPQFVRFWDVATGKPSPDLTGGYPLGGAFSPDGRLVVMKRGSLGVIVRMKARVAGPTGAQVVCEIATGAPVTALPDASSINAAAFSRDGRFLATAAADGSIEVWETATWTRRTEFKGHRDRPTTLAFGPTGQLFSGGADTTVLAWDTRPPRPVSPVTLASAWDDLAAKESFVSFRSEGRFLASPAETVKLFAAKVERPEPFDPRRMERLLADLGSDDFATREAATQTLRGLDRRALPFLEKALKDARSIEVRARVQTILERRHRAALTPEQLRQTRAVMLLEQIGDRPAQDLLRRWAGGPAGAPLVDEAAAALERLQARIGQRSHGDND